MRWIRTEIRRTRVKVITVDSRCHTTQRRRAFIIGAYIEVIAVSGCSDAGARLTLVVASAHIPVITNGALARVVIEAIAIKTRVWIRTIVVCAISTRGSIGGDIGSAKAIPIAGVGAVTIRGRAISARCPRRVIPTVLTSSIAITGIPYDTGGRLFPA